jgi:hypothetical protein
MDHLRQEAERLVAEVSSATDASPNEANLRHEIEIRLQQACSELDIPWTAYQLDRNVQRRGRPARFVDVVHGAIVIEYEPPRCFRGREGAALAKAREQAEEYAALLAAEEARAIARYVLVAWDGAHLSFGRYDQGGVSWDAIEPFRRAAAERLLVALRDDGVPLVHPQLLRALVGPLSAVGAQLLPRFFDSLIATGTERARTTKTQLLFVEWQRLFGQVVGIPSDRLRIHLREMGAAHERDYLEDPPAYLFALNTYIALVAKLVAALALPGAAEDITATSVPVLERVKKIESGDLFRDAGILNMLNGDFFSWYVDDEGWASFASSITDIIDTLRWVSFDVTRKDPQSTRDLFKGLYMTFAPRALRHALGEFYTPDWLAAHALDEARWTPRQSLLDPTCGTGTFVLEGLRRRLVTAQADEDATTLLRGLAGFDLNPLAVLAARASLVVFLGGRLHPDSPVRIPIYLADAINPATEEAGVYTHTIQTERGAKVFRLPVALVEHPDYFALMQRARDLVDEYVPESDILPELAGEPAAIGLKGVELDHLRLTIHTLIELHKAGWNGIWCSIIADRFAAGAVPPAAVVAGNPPWVKWSHLPPEYAEFIKPQCVKLGVFSDDAWVGGIESDISTVITYEALSRYCARKGTLAFFITGTVFANESSQGFRRWRLPALSEPTRRRPEPFTVVKVEDYAAVRPFEGVNNHPTLLILRRNGKPTTYPVTYRVWQPTRIDGRVKRQFADAETFRSEAPSIDLKAEPVPGTDAGPWLKGTAAQLLAWSNLFEQQAPNYQARKGVTTDANGVFFVKVGKRSRGKGAKVAISNDPTLGRRQLQVRSAQVESEHLFPLLRGQGVTAFQATPDADYCVLVPQREMHGDPDLPRTAPGTHRYLKGFHDTLIARSSYRRFQRDRPWWSLWSTGSYTFAPFKVVWKEISGGRFAAAYVGSYAHPILGEKVIVPDHKVYFVPMWNEDEAAFLTGFLNAPLVSSAVAAYAAALSLGVSVVEYLRIPEYDPRNAKHKQLAKIAKTITVSASAPSMRQQQKLTALVAAMCAIPSDALTSLEDNDDGAAPALVSAQAR